MRRTTRLIVILLLFLGAVYLTLFRLIAPLIDRLLNRVSQHPPYRARAEAAALHRQLFVVDLHSDPYLWNRDLSRRHRYGHVDVPRLVEGHVALQTVGIAARIPWGLNFEHNANNSDMLAGLVLAQRWPRRTWRSPLQRALYHTQRLHELVAASPERLLLVASRDDLDELLARRRRDPQALGFLLGLEGVHALEGDLHNLDLLDEAGVRLVGLVHFFDNKAGGSAHGLEKGGLTPWGRNLIRDCEARGLTVDLAHASPQLIADVCALSTRPLLVSHTGVRGTYDSLRNLGDDAIRCVAASGGLIGIALFQEAVGGPTLADTARAMAYVADLVGVQHVGLGSDYDGAIRAPVDSSGLSLLTQALLDAGFASEEVAAIMGGNALRFLQETLPV